MRKLMRKRRAKFLEQLSPSERNMVFKHPPTPVKAMISNAENIAFYAPIASEAPTAGLVEYCRAQEKHLLLPHILQEQGKMEFLRWNADDVLLKSDCATSEPPSDRQSVSPDLIFVPLLAFDRRLNRLGQGGGFYDRALFAFPDAQKIGLAWSIQEVDMLPTDTHDQRLNAILTECEIIEKQDIQQ